MTDAGAYADVIFGRLRPVGLLIEPAHRGHRRVRYWRLEELPSASNAHHLFSQPDFVGCKRILLGAILRCHLK